MTNDPILEELHQIREQLAAKFNYDVFAIVADIQAQEKKEDRPLVTLNPHRIETEEPATEATQKRAA
ncbi:MAG: hypothetical protein JNK38_25560 [Acidobacteria bacterium]|nr:hypothetical protein [Acidobacteriota bacterium]